MLMVDPHLVSIRVDPGVPVWALQSYSGPIRSAIIAMKEQGRADLSVPFGMGIARAVAQLGDWGLLDSSGNAPISLVPAPSRFFAARRRGGDPVTRICRLAAEAFDGQVKLASILKTSALVRDSVGLSAMQRGDNLAGKVGFTKKVHRKWSPSEWEKLRGSSVLVVDDVVTTGTTLTQSVNLLRDAGVSVCGGLVIAKV